MKKKLNSIKPNFIKQTHSRQEQVTLLCIATTSPIPADFSHLTEMSNKSTVCSVIEEPGKYQKKVVSGHNNKFDEAF